MTRRWPAIGLVAVVPLAGLLLFAALVEELVEWRVLVALDRWVDEELNERATPWLTAVMKAVSWLGGPPGLLVVTAAAAVVLGIRGQVRGAALVALGYVGAELLADRLKLEFNRTRPSVTHRVTPLAGGYSFPSGHATASIAVYGAVVFVALITVRRRSTRRLVAAIGLVLVALIGFSRLYLGEHFPSDVLAGWLVGLLWLALLIGLLFGYSRTPPR